MTAKVKKRPTPTRRELDREVEQHGLREFVFEDLRRQMTDLQWGAT